MTLILIAAVALGLAAAGIVTGLPRLAGARAPRWAGPAAAGLAMFAFMLWNAYTWFERSVAVLPAGAAVAETYPHSSVFQPWTLLVPRVTRFAAVLPSGRTAEGLLRADVLLAERFAGERRIAHLFDCAARRRAVLPAGAAPARAAALDWTAPPRDPLIAAACGPREGEPTHGKDRPAG